MELILGTANAGSKYSLNQYQKLDKKNLIKIIKFAKKNKIKIYDTAPKYKNAEKILGNLSLNKLNVNAMGYDPTLREPTSNLKNEYFDPEKIERK